MRQKTPEAGVLRACLDLLAAERIWHERRNTGVLRDGKRFIRFSQPGTADILAVPIVKWPGRGTSHEIGDLLALWIECKSDSGKQGEAQKAFQAEVEAAGHFYLLARSSDELKQWLVDHGAMRQK